MNFIKEYWFLITFLLNTVLVPLATFLIGRYRKQKSDIDLLKHGMYAMQKSDLLKTCELYRRQKYCTIEQKEALDELSQSYHNLGGNSFITELVNQCLRLPDYKKEGK